MRDDARPQEAPQHEASAATRADAGGALSGLPGRGRPRSPVAPSTVRAGQPDAKATVGRARSASPPANPGASTKPFHARGPLASTPPVAQTFHTDRSGLAGPGGRTGRVRSRSLSSLLGFQDDSALAREAGRSADATADDAAQQQAAQESQARQEKARGLLEEEAGRDVKAAAGEAGMTDPREVGELSAWNSVRLGLVTAKQAWALLETPPSYALFQTLLKLEKAHATGRQALLARDGGNDGLPGGSPVPEA
ncbi:hypothetical protein CY652_02600 [Burkholderia sp. WAC0059]|nr:hypothetical protein CY652_02600 [Burkholderia sp. WAC0059]